MSKVLKILFGDPNKRLLTELQKEVSKINAFEPNISKLVDDELKAKTLEFKKRLEAGETVDAVLHEAFAVVREAAKRTINQRHFDVQLIGGLILHRGQIAEMRTGEGKTLTSTLALYTNALSAKGAHLVTVNDYLAKRDCVWMGQIFHFLGLSVGCIQQFDSYLYDPSYRTSHTKPVLPLAKGELEGVATANEEELGTESFQIHDEFLRPCSRRESFAADITYGTNNQFGFDYLRDNMASDVDQTVMRGMPYAIIDEIDSILIDEARTPLIISAPAEKSNDLYYRFADIANTLKEHEDFNVDEKMRTATLSESGIDRIEKALGIDNLYAIEQGQYQRYADTALRARANYHKDVHYIVKDGEVIIVDEFTGRLMPGRRFSEGIHQAIEAKEKVEIQRESQTLGTITFQNLFRMYEKLAGMTGTASTEAEEFSKIYQLEVVEIPTNQPVTRIDRGDKIFKNEKGKYLSVIEEVKAASERGQPVLIGTASVEKNELLHTLLDNAGVRHEILNAKNHEREAEIIAQAGRVGAVTLATNMAGRGVDIKLGGNPTNPEEEKRVKDLGGLYVIGTERHESRRIDNQLRGRSGRQGDPGLTQFYISMEDDLMRIFGSDRTRGLMDRLGIPDEMPIENKMITGAVEKAQMRVEGHHFDSRKHILEYDDVLNKHREVIYARRLEVLTTFTDDPEDLRMRILDIIEGEVEQVVLFHTGEFVEHKNDTTSSTVNTTWNIAEILQTMQTIVAFSQQQRKQIEELSINVSHDKQSLAQGRTQLIEAIMSVITEQYDKLTQSLPEIKDLHLVEKAVILRAIDMLWIDHLEAMRALRTGIGLQGYGQRDPLIEYKREGFNIFQTLLSSINQEIAYTFFKYAHHAVDMNVQAELNTSLLSRTGVVMAGADKGETKLQLSQGGFKGGAVSEKAGSPAKAPAKAGRNEPCPCGSGKKFKKCHGA